VLIFTVHDHALINILKVEDAIKIFNIQYPGCTAIFHFDCSSAHGAFAKDALRANNMRGAPGGKQPKMRDTRIPLSNPHPHLRGQVQTMVFPADHTVHPDKPKGLEVVLKERGLYDMLRKGKHGNKPLVQCHACGETSERKTAREREARSLMEANPDMYASIRKFFFTWCQFLLILQTPFIGEALAEVAPTFVPEDTTNGMCCMLRCMSLQDDFLAEKPLLQTVIENAGHVCLFLPKYHCELNPIELYWAFAKRREHHSGYSCIQ
jgi:hypothetical protein